MSQKTRFDLVKIHRIDPDMPDKGTPFEKFPDADIIIELEEI